MAKKTTGAKTWLLTDVEGGVWVEKFLLTAEKAGLRRGKPAAGSSAKPTVRGGRGGKTPAWSITKRTLRGGLGDGVDIVEIDNGAFAFSVLPTRGMGVWRGSYRGLPVGWRAPVRGPVHPKFVNLADRAGLGWLAGFDEMIVRCGLDSNGAPCVDTVIDNNGNPRATPLPLHGRIANQPACRVEVEYVPGDSSAGGGELAVCGVVEESMLFGPSLRLTTRISTAVGGNSFTIDDEVTNLRGIDAEVQMLYHCNFGPPFLEAAARFLAPSIAVAPRDARAAEDAAGYATYLPPTPGYVEQVYYHDVAADRDGMAVAALVNAAGDKAVVVRFGRAGLPCFAQWKNTIPASDGYVTGLEPGTNFPNAKPFERANGRVVKLPPGGAWRGRVRVEILDSAESVAGLEREVAALAAGLPSGRPCQVHPAPAPGWS